jgi:hypothetical protein
VESGWVSDLLVSGHFIFRVISGRVGSVIWSFSVGSFRIFGRIRSSRLSSHLVSSHFGFWVISGRVESVIESSSVGSFRISGHIRSGRVGYWAI